MPCWPPGPSWDWQIWTESCLESWDSSLNSSVRFLFYFLFWRGEGKKGVGTSFGAEDPDLSRAQGQASLATSSFELSLLPALLGTKVLGKSPIPPLPSKRESRPERGQSRRNVKNLHFMVNFLVLGFDGILTFNKSNQSSFSPGWGGKNPEPRASFLTLLKRKKKKDFDILIYTFFMVGFLFCFVFVLVVVVPV